MPRSGSAGDFLPLASSGGHCVRSQGLKSGCAGEQPGSTRLRLGVSGGSRWRTGRSALSGHGRSFAQALERRLQFFRPGFAHPEIQLATTLDQAVRMDQADAPGPLPVGPVRILA